MRNAHFFRWGMAAAGMIMLAPASGKSADDHYRNFKIAVYSDTVI